MWSWWSNPLSAQDGSSSNSTPPDGIRQISDSVYSLSEPVEPEMEIVFIHGLQLSDYNQAYWKTWLAGVKDENGKEIIWPMTWLKEELPRARILTLSYDSSARRTSTQGRMDSFTIGMRLVGEMVGIAKIGQQNCPVVFVCHCLGGLIVKEIVITAHGRFGNDPKYVEFLQNIRGFHFYATPHQGSKLADLASHLPNMGKMGELLLDSNRNRGRLNVEFERIERDHFPNRWQFSVVAETIMTTSHGFSAEVVDESSARHVYEKFLAVSADHFGVCKPESKVSSSYRSLKKFIDDIVMFEQPLTGISDAEIWDQDLMITIFRVGNEAHSARMLSDMDFRESLVMTKRSISEILRRMEDVLNKGAVVIWQQQCQHLLETYQGGVEKIVKVLDALVTMVKEGPMIWLNPPVVNFMCSTLVCPMLEGEALLLFCSDKDNYNKAAFALSSPPPSVPAFSRFGLVLRNLGWTLDFIFCIEQQVIHGNRSSFGDWRWCEKRCRPIFIQAAGVEEDEILEADGRRQTHDREALLTSLRSKPKKASLVNNKENQDKLEAIWTERLLATSDTPRPDSVPNCFWIDNPDSFEHVDHIGHGAFKVVDKKKWLGEIVAVATVTRSPKELLEKEASLLARVQHPNVVEFMGCAYKGDDLNNSKSFLATELMEQDLESLIAQQLGSRDRYGTSIGGPPFALPVAVDIALQIVEAMIHLRECGVMHRDLKPNNCLVSPKYRKDSSPCVNDVPIYYTIKLIDFGISKLRGEDSYFTTLRLGTACYMAPELNVSPKKPYSWPADVWSFGMTCYKILTGRAPFETNILRDVSELIREGKRPEFPFECPQRLKKLIQKCWARDPRARPTFCEIREVLWQCKFYYAWSSNAVK